MTAEERAALLGDELTRAIDAWTHDPTNDALLSDFCAALVGRCASMAAQAVVSLYERLDALERRAHDGE